MSDDFYLNWSEPTLQKSVEATLAAETGSGENGGIPKYSSRLSETKCIGFF